jgi:hypothetical protein
MQKLWRGWWQTGGNLFTIQNESSPLLCLQNLRADLLRYLSGASKGSAGQIRFTAQDTGRLSPASHRGGGYCQTFSGRIIVAYTI